MSQHRSTEPNRAVKSIIKVGAFCRRIFPLVFMVSLVVSFSIGSGVLGAVTVLIGIVAVTLEIWSRKASR